MRMVPWLPLLLLVTTACSRAPLLQSPATPPVPPPALQPIAAPPIVVAGYDLANPVQSFALPNQLREVSGIAAVDAHTVACLQDEQGELFFFDLATGRIAREAKFGSKGDYEGLARVSNSFFALRSDGQLLHLVARGEHFEVEQSLTLPFGEKEYEGVAYDRANGRLVIAPKSVPKDKDEKGLRPLFALDLATMTAVKEPLLVVRVDDVLAAATKLGVAVPTKTTDKGKERPLLRLHFAEVAVHQDTGELWLLSAVDRALLVLDGKGAVKGLHFFAATDLPQPEGACFLPDGRLVLASEGKDGPAVMRVYAKAK